MVWYPTPLNHPPQFDDGEVLVGSSAIMSRVAAEATHGKKAAVVK